MQKRLSGYFIGPDIHNRISFLVEGVVRDWKIKTYCKPCTIKDLPRYIYTQGEVLRYFEVPLLLLNFSYRSTIKEKRKFEKYRGSAYE